MPTGMKAALVTGSGKRRVGSAVAEALARNGYAIAVHYRSSAHEAADTVERLRALGVQAEAFQADLTEDASAQALVDAALSRFGQIDALVNCAAVWQSKRLEDVTAEDVRRHFETNALGTFLVSRLVGLEMVKRPEGGCIITLGDWAIERPYLHYAAYFPSKGAIPAMTRSLAVELGHRNPNVRVNCIHPGPVMLPPDLPEEEKHAAIAATLVKREGSPDHVAKAVLALIENDFITGVCLPVDGGRTVYSI